MIKISSLTLMKIINMSKYEDIEKVVQEIKKLEKQAKEEK